MHSHSIENQKIETKNPETKNKTHRPPLFKKPEKKIKLPLSLEKETFTVINEMLKLQKTEAGAAVPSLTFNQIVEASHRIEKLDPSAQVMQLFHKLIESMTHIDQNGIQETTFFLDGEAFNSSIFQGAKITITEYSTAPKSFNIEFSADTKTLTFFETHASDLLNALQRGNFGFTVHRLDTSLTTEDEKHTHPRVERDLEKEDSQT